MPKRNFFWQWPREGMCWFMWARQNYGSRWIVWRVFARFGDLDPIVDRANAP